MNRKPFLNKKISKKVKGVNTSLYLKKVLVALSAQTGCPEMATEKYIRLIEFRLLHEKSEFLKILAALPILGLRVLGSDIPPRSDYGLRVRKGPFPDLFKWHFRYLEMLSKKASPTPNDVLRARRILTLFSIGKMIKMSSTQRIKRERQKYALRVLNRVDYRRVNLLHRRYTHEIREFLDFVYFYRNEPKIVMTDGSGIVPGRPGRVHFDPTCYSLKSLAKAGNHRKNTSMIYTVFKHLITDDVFSRAGRDPLIHGKQCIIVEHGGKYRGITPYYHPLIHSASTYRYCRAVLQGWEADVSLNQGIGHERLKLLTTLNRTIISADASNFTDSIDIDLAHVFLQHIHQDGFLEYLKELNVSTIYGPVRTPLPLMGLKGCYELSCCLLAFSVWRQARMGKLTMQNMAHACDDLVGFGSFEGFRDAYQFIGASLNPKKTVISKSTGVFCGQMYWLGNRVTPVRISISTLAESTSGNEVLPMCRMFVTNARPVWGPKAFKVISKIIYESCTRVVPPNCVRFDLPVKLGGIPIKRSNIPLDKILSKRRVLRYALYNIPFEEIVRDARSYFIGFIRLGKPAKMPDGITLPSISIPKPVSGSWKRRKQFIDRKVDGLMLTQDDVFDFYYNDIKPKA